MIDPLRKAAEMALDYIEQALQLHDQQYQRHPSTEKDRKAIVDDLETLRQALAQPEQEPETVMAKYEFQTYAAYKTDGEIKIGVVPEQEPVAWQDPQYKTLIEPHKAHPDWIPLYTAPPKREWVSATHIEIGNLWAQHKEVYGFAMALDDLLKEKNT